MQGVELLDYTVATPLEQDVEDPLQHVWVPPPTSHFHFTREAWDEVLSTAAAQCRASAQTTITEEGELERALATTPTMEEMCQVEAQWQCLQQTDTAATLRPPAHPQLLRQTAEISDGGAEQPPLPWLQARLADLLLQRTIETYHTHRLVRENEQHHIEPLAERMARVAGTTQDGADESDGVGRGEILLAASVEFPDAPLEHGM